MTTALRSTSIPTATATTSLAPAPHCSSTTTTRSPLHSRDGAASPIIPVSPLLFSLPSHPSKRSLRCCRPRQSCMFAHGGGFCNINHHRVVAPFLFSLLSHPSTQSLRCCSLLVVIPLLVATPPCWRRRQVLSVRRGRGSGGRGVGIGGAPFSPSLPVDFCLTGRHGPAAEAAAITISDFELLDSSAITFSDFELLDSSALILHESAITVSAATPSAASSPFPPPLSIPSYSPSPPPSASFRLAPTLSSRSTPSQAASLSLRPPSSSSRLSGVPVGCSTNYLTEETLAIEAGSSSM